jgi:hypothetical protein
MSSETAQTVMVAITAVAAVVWLIGLWFLLGSYRMGRTDPELNPDHFGLVEPLPNNWFLGSAEVDGPPSVLIEKAAALLVKETSGAVKILEKTNAHLAFQWVGANRSGLPEQGQLRFIPLASGRTRIDYAIELPAFRWLLRLGVLFQVCGLVALLAGYGVVSTYCLDSPEPGIRAQAIQMVQVIHFLWPPFLFGALYRQRQRIVMDTFGLLLRNLPFYAG